MRIRFLLVTVWRLLTLCPSLVTFMASMCSIGFGCLLRLLSGLLVGGCSLGLLVGLLV